ncbi:MAG: glutamine synthetase family protein [Marinifilaceae bacterium]
MSNTNHNLNPDILVRHLQKSREKFTKIDIISFAKAYGVEMINFRYLAQDGKLKVLNFVITSQEHLESIFNCGERVDGSSLFSFISAGSSDLYVVPRFRTAFLNPFEKIPTIDIFCSFYDVAGQPLESSPENILKKAHTSLKESTGFSFKCMGELEYYISAPTDGIYRAPDQKGYHESSPFVKWEALRREALHLIAQCGGKIKYGHTEVGSFSADGNSYEQHEIEFSPVDPEACVVQLLMAKWIIRKLAARDGALVSWAPKIMEGNAGSGLHIHMQLEKDGKNICLDNNKLSDPARKAIAGILELATGLTAFGNTIPTAYLRLVPHQEAPTYVCWGDRNRSVLVRVPLGWTSGVDMVKDANPFDEDSAPAVGKQTFEFRVPDGSADLYLLIAGLIVGCKHGLQKADALAEAERLYAPVDIFSDSYKDKIETLEQLPGSCFDSAVCLEQKRAFFEEDGIFPAGIIDAVIKNLKAHNDKGLNERLIGKTKETMEVVSQFIHCQ